MATARIVLDAGTKGPVINPNIYGHFAEHLGRCVYEGLWVGEKSRIPNVRGIRKDVVAALRKMKPTAFFINVGRGPVHDQKALYKALKEGWIAGAGLDVLEKEPPDPDDPILTLDNVVFTPHYASYTEEAYHELRVKTAENAAAVLRGEWPKYFVNPEVKTTARLLKRR